MDYKQRTLLAETLELRKRAAVLSRIAEKSIDKILKGRADICDSYEIKKQMVAVSKLFAEQYDETRRAYEAANNSRA